MLVVFPFHQGDANLMRELLDWCIELGRSKSNHDALLVADAGVQWADCSDLLKLSNECFSSAKIIMIPTPIQGWIPGSNALFKEAAMWAEQAGREFLWMEADAIPLRPNWLDEIGRAYAACGKPFMGTLLKPSHAKFPNPYMEGVAVYPSDTWTRFKPYWDENESWVITTAQASVKECVHTPLIQMLWGDFGISTSFVPFLTIHSQ